MTIKYSASNISEKFPMPRSQEFVATIMPKIIHADHEILCFCNFLYTRVEMMFCIKLRTKWKVFIPTQILVIKMEKE